jgi:hypothetical protein
MVQRRAEEAGLDTHICNHTWRGTGSRPTLENGGTLENAKVMAAQRPCAPRSSTTIVVTT